MKTLKQMVTSLALTSVMLTPSVQTMAAGNLNIATTPLLLAAQSPANVYWMIDDSGSMDWEVLAKGHFPSWCYAPDPRHVEDDRIGNCKVSSFKDDGDWYVRQWRYDRNNKWEGRNTSNSSIGLIFHSDHNWDRYRGNVLEYENNDNDDFDMRDWRGFSSALNTMWYDPTVNYIPWAGVTAFETDASFTAAREEARELTNSDTRNLADIDRVRRMRLSDGVRVYESLLLPPISPSTTGDSPMTYVIHHDTHGWTGTAPDQDADDRTLGANGMVDMWDEYTQVDVGTSGTIVLQHFTWRQANGYSDSGHVYNNGVRGIVRSPADSTPTPLSGSAQDLRDYLSGAKPLPNKTDSFSITGNVVNEAKQNIANWFQYYRKRILTAKAAVGQVMVRAPGFYYGLDTINQGGGSTRYMASSEPNQPSHDIDLLDSFYRGSKASNGGTPLRTALKRAGQFYERSSNYYDGGWRSPPIKTSCQPSFTVLMSDGYWNGDSSPYVGNQDGDGESNTLADVAYRYYTNDLRGDHANNVPTSDKDPRSDQHMVTFTVAFGLVGNLTALPGEDWPEQDLDGNPLEFGLNMAADGTQPEDGNNWGDPTGGDGPAKIDDMWHAAWNSNGIFKSAGNPAELITALGDALSEIESRALTSSGVAASSGALVTGSALFQPSYQTEDWSGDLVERPLNPTDGSILGTGWKASNNLRNWAGRVLITMKPSVIENPNTPGLNRSRSGVGVPFRTPNLSAAQQADLANGDGDAAFKLRWLRGDRAMEEKNGGAYRDRTDSGATSTSPPMLGDIVDSTPVFVGAPPKTPKGNTTAEKTAYTSFANSKKNRREMVYVGANDGILHGFNAANGNQEFGYIPNMLIPKLHLLTNPAYTHEFFVNTTPTVEDVYTKTDEDGAGWRTMLVSGLGQGGQGLFALDITNPTSMTEGNAGNVVLWEYEDDTEVVLDTAGSVYGFNIDSGGNIIPGSYGSGDGVTAKLNEDYGSASVGHIFGPQPVAPTNAPGSGTTFTTAVVFGNGYNASAPDTHKDNSPTKLKNLIQSRLDILPNHPGGNVPQNPIYKNNLGNTGFSQYRYQTLSQAFDNDTSMFVDAAMDSGSTFRYNSMTVGKGTPVTVPSAALMIVDAGTGKLVKKIPVTSPQSNPASSHYDPTAVDNGLSTPVLYDLNGDGRVDYAYAGDLHGNLWKFNLTDTNPNNWEVEGQTNAGEDMPLFVGLADRPVITRPAIIENTSYYRGGLLIAFGTGKFIETIDKDPANQKDDQYFYVVWDKLELDTVQNTIEYDDNNILEQTISTNELSSAGLLFRTTSDNAIDWTTHIGWKMRLIDNGERVVNHPIIRNGRVIFTTFTPDADPCAAGGKGWLMEVSAFDGGPIEGQQPFDYNGDGVIDIADINAAGGIVSGVSQPGGGFPSMPTIVTGADGTVEYKYSSNSGGDLTKIDESTSTSKGRQSWRYLLRK